ncbi:MAG: hypothetical protein J7J20_00440 [Desulfurococcales archaeon]|nr:hypothetical protein [Desulfurococcales archaeon]
MSEDYLRLKSRLTRATMKLTEALLRAKYVKVVIKWSRHEKLGRCSVELQHRSVVLTFKVPLEGMTTEDLAVSCIEALGNPARTAYLIMGVVGFLLAAAVWYLLPPTVSDPTKSAASAIAMTAAVLAAVAGGVGLFLHERRLKDIKRKYVALTKADRFSLKMYSMMVDIVSWVLRKCEGRSKAVMNAPEIVALVRKNYGDVLKVLSEKT